MSNLANLTPFAAAQVTNRVLVSKGFDVEVRPQMMYSYAKKGTIASNYETRTGTEKIYFDGEAFKAWLDRYVERVATGTATSNVDYDKLAEQYM